MIYSQASAEILFARLAHLHKISVKRSYLKTSLDLRQLVKPEPLQERMLI